jgi:hypothetical protein
LRCYFKGSPGEQRFSGNAIDLTKVLGYAPEHGIIIPSGDDQLQLMTNETPSLKLGEAPVLMEFSVSILLLCLLPVEVFG